MNQLLKSSLRTAAGLCALAVALQAAAQAIQPYRPLGQVRPVSVTPCRIIARQGDTIRLETGPTVPYTGGGVRVARQTSIAFDEFEFNYDSVTGDILPDENASYGAACGTGDLRWGFGNIAMGPHYNDMRTAANAAGRRATRLGFAWMIDDPAHVGTVNLANGAQLVITSERFDTTLAGANSAATRGDLTGVLIQFGPETGPTPGYYWSDVDLTGTGTFLRMPYDANGGYISVHGDYNAGTGTLTIGNCQDMQWGLKAGNPFGPENNLQWSDDNPFNGSFDAGDLRNFTFATCPSVLGTMMVFFYDPPTPETLVPISETLNLGKFTGGSLASWAADDANARVIQKFVVPNFTSPIIRVTLNFTTTKPEPFSINFNVKAKMVDAGAFKIREFMQRKTDNVFVQCLADSTINLAYAVYSGTATGFLADYVGGGGAMTGRIEVQQTGPSVAILPSASFEYGQLVVTG